MVLGERQEVVDVSDFTEVRADRIQEQQLQVDVSFDEVLPRLMRVTVQQIEILDAGVLVQSEFDDIAVNHLLVSFAHLCDLIFHFVLKDGVVVLHFLVARNPHSILFLLIEGFSQKHLQCGQLHYGGVAVLFGEVGIVNGVTGLGTGHAGGVCAIFLNGLLQSDEVALGL